MLTNIIVACVAICIGIALTPYILTILSVCFWLAVAFIILWSWRNR